MLDTFLSNFDDCSFLYLISIHENNEMFIFCYASPQLPFCVFRLLLRDP